ncbi:MAG: regulator of cell morphogenesis and NO signaling [Planctomycetota bacterium]|jgi:regulator of cell morphogenesis and NO signaling
MQSQIQNDTTLADLAVRHAGASRVFHRHGLDFCCNGRVSLEDACRKSDLNLAAITSELEAAIAETPQDSPITEAALPVFVEYILENFHAAHREEVPRLIGMARKVEQVHGDKPDCPKGLAAFLEHMSEELEMHMQKEEQILFPMIVGGRGAMTGMPISVMENEHQDHGKNLQRLRNLVNNYVPPEGACNTWRALYLGLEQLERDLMEHIHLENNSLFPRALKS